MPLRIVLAGYRAGAWLAHRLPSPTGKWGASVAGRSAATSRWVQWALRQRRPGPLVWVHGASAGELSAARPVIEHLRRRLPGLQVAYTHSSPSAVGWGAPAPDPVDFVPLDEPTPIALCLAALQPSVLAFSRGDVWPELLWQAARAQVPAVVVGASMRPHSLRDRIPARWWYRAFYRQLAWVGAVSRADAERWIRAGAEPDAVEVTGDPRHGDAIQREPALERLASLGHWAHGRSVLVAGSIEPEDESPLIDAAASVLPSHPDAALLIVPHEPSASAVQRVRERCGAAGLSAEVWRPGAPEPGEPVIIVDATGLLADLYALGGVGYVGGGFRPGRVHAVVEPAAWARRVIVGPAAVNDRDVAGLRQVGAAVVLPRRGASAALAAIWRDWLADQKPSEQAGLAGRATLSGAAAAHTSARLLGYLTG